jgi:hypothetical protein
MGMVSIRERIADRPNSLGGRRRAARWEWLVRTFPDLDEMTVLDLGGSADTWTTSAIHPAHVHVINIEPLAGNDHDWVEIDYADACALPQHILSRRYDLAFSNSVLEHVGGHERRMRFAEAVHTVAPRHWVQTPYRYFPVEPHWIAPGMQFLPIRARAALARRWPLAHVRSASLRDALDGVLWTELIDRTQMRYYFPDSVIRSERLLGLAKSLIAVQTGRDPG